MAEYLDGDPKRARLQVRTEFESKERYGRQLHTEEVLVSRDLHDRAVSAKLPNAVDFWRRFFLEQHDAEWASGVQAIRLALEVAQMRLELLEESQPQLTESTGPDRPRLEAIEEASRFVERLAAMTSIESTSVKA